MNDAKLTTEQMQSFTLDSLTKLLQDAQDTSFDWKNSIIFVLILAAAGFLAKNWLNKTDKTVSETVKELSKIQKVQAVEEYKTREQDIKLQDLKIKNERVSIKLGEVMVSMGKEQITTFKLLTKIGLLGKQNENDIKNLKDENIIISKEVRNLKNQK